MHLEDRGYTSLAALSSDWYWEQDSRFRFTKMVRSPCSNPLHCFDESLSLGQPRWDLPGARALSETWDQHRAQLEAGQPFRDFHHVVDLGACGMLALSSSGEPLFDAQARLAGYRGTARDITPMGTWSQDSTQPGPHDEKSRQLGAQLSLTLQTMTDGFFTLDREWRFTYVNPAGERILRRPASHLLGRPIWHEFPEAVGSNFQRHYERAVQEHAQVTFVEFYPPLELWVQVRACPSADGLTVFFNDVSESVRAEQQIAQLNAGLEEQLKERTAELELRIREMETFSYSVAHDLRSPLGAISGFGQLLETEHGPGASPRSRHLLRRIQAAARQMEEMTEGLLALARVSPSEMRVQPVDLGRIAAAVLAKLREHDPDRQVDVDVMPDLWGQADIVLLTQALSNLIGNAWKFTGHQAQGRIEVGRQAGADGETVFFVKDNGAGFDMNYASKLFGVFVRLHSTSEFEGTGIGLAIVKKVIDRHGGRIWAESEPSQGARFYFTLKAAACPASAQAGDRASRPSS